MGIDDFGILKDFCDTRWNLPRAIDNSPVLFSRRRQMVIEAGGRQRAMASELVPGDRILARCLDDTPQADSRFQDPDLRPDLLQDLDKRRKGWLGMWQPAFSPIGLVSVGSIRFHLTWIQLPKPKDCSDLGAQRALSRLILRLASESRLKTRKRSNCL